MLHQFFFTEVSCACLRGARSHRGSPVTIGGFGVLDLAISEGQVFHMYFELLFLYLLKIKTNSPWYD